MPQWNGMQLITFATELDENQSFRSTWVTAKRGQTILGVVATFGHPELAYQVARMNGIRSYMSKLTHGERLKLPGTFSTVSFNVLSDAVPSTITDGYAVYEIVNRPGRVGINKFDGYNPVAMQLNLQFEAYQGQNGTDVENSISKLERMGCRGQFAGTGQSPPPAVRVSTTDNHGQPVWCIPSNYQWSPHNPSAPLWRVTAITWDATADSVLRDDNGKRVRQLCQVTLTQYTPVAPISRSVTERARAAHKA
jgi:hypothetical protein